MYITNIKNGIKTTEYSIEIAKLFNASKTLSNGITILFQTNLPDMILEFGALAAAKLPNIAAEYAAEGMKSPIKLTPTEYIQETDYLAGIAEKCTQEDFDWISVLPLTKAGKLPKGRRISVASSKCIAVTANQSNNDYFSAEQLQLMLVPVWPDQIGFIQNNIMPDTMALVLTDGPLTTKTPPIFDHNGNASTPVTVRASYLKDADITPGTVYLSGKTEFLYLGRIVLPDNSNMWDDINKCHFAYADYCYIKMTKSVRNTISSYTTQEDLFRAVVAYSKSKDRYISDICSFTKNPKKFTEQRDTLATPATLGSNGYHEFSLPVYENTPERVWFVSHNDPNIVDGQYLMKP